MQAKIGELWLQTRVTVSFLYATLAVHIYTHKSKSKGRRRTYYPSNDTLWDCCVNARGDSTTQCSDLAVWVPMLCCYEMKVWVPTSQVGSSQVSPPWTFSPSGWYLTSDWFSLSTTALFYSSLLTCCCFWSCFNVSAFIGTYSQRDHSDPLSCLR